MLTTGLSYVTALAATVTAFDSVTAVASKQQLTICCSDADCSVHFHILKDASEINDLMRFCSADLIQRRL